MTRRPIHMNAHQLTMKRAQRLSAEDVDMQARLLHAATREFARGFDCPTHWRSVADCANMAETLASMGLSSGPEADRVIATAQTALADVHQRQSTSGRWTLYADEIDALQWLVSLHTTQLQAASYGEFEAAYKRTHERMSQALAGNAGARVLVVGDV